MIELGAILFTTSALAQAAIPASQRDSSRAQYVTELSDEDLFNSQGSCKKCGIIKAATLSELNQCSLLPAGWDGQNALPPSMNAIQDARTFVFAIKSGMALPHISISQKGTVGIYWETKHVFLDVLFAGKGTYSFYGKLNDVEYFGDDIPVSFMKLHEDIDMILSSTL